MTGKQITERAARITYPDLPQEAIERIAAAIWNASPTGELWHVCELTDLLEGPEPPVQQYVKALRNVEAVASEWI